ncbi:MAG: hypothetical protein KJZ69_00735 [Phycisphaerales bacterium]|nr:hypothetical protein [Phycisphaerales bacterium]
MLAHDASNNGSERRSDARVGSGRGLRAHDRYAWPAKVQVCWFTTEGASDAVGDVRTLECIDLGLGGIGIISAEPVPPGTRGAVLLLGGNEAGWVRGLEVVHARYDPSLGAHVLGGKWLANLPGAERFVVERSKGGPRLSRRFEEGRAPTDREAA